MKKTLTDAAEVTAVAFAETEYMPETAVSTAVIAVAEERYIVPVVGRALYEKMLEGQYGTLREEYVVPAAAFFTRLEMQPLTNVRSGRFGTAVPYSENCRPADRRQILDLRHTLREKGRTLLRRLSDHLERHADDYPEYSSQHNILNRCSTDGGIVQIL